MASQPHTILKELVNQNIYFLRQGRCLIADLEPECYSDLKDAAGKCTINDHFLHCLDMYNCFFRGLQVSLINYINPERTEQIQQNQDLAERKIVEHIYQLLELRENPPTSYKLEIDLRDKADTETDPQKIISSIPRELYMLSNHTIHHYALISQILLIHDLECPEHFGVAPKPTSPKRWINS